WTLVTDSIAGLGSFAVNVDNGKNLIVRSTDMAFGHRWAPAFFSRVYNSLSQHDYANTDGSLASSFGNGWTNTYDAHIAVNTGANGTYGITVYDNDGARYDYLPTDSTGNTLTVPLG